MSRTPSPAPRMIPDAPLRRSSRRFRSVSPSVRRRLVDESPLTPVRVPSSPRVPNAPRRQQPHRRLVNAPLSLLRSARASPAESFFFLQRLPVVVVIGDQRFDPSWEEESEVPVTPPPRSGRPRTPGAPKRARRE